MEEPHPGSTSRIAADIDRLCAGDSSAIGDILARAEGRIRALARRMLRDYPVVRSWEQTDDVFQMAMIRLHGALHSVEVADPKHLLRLAAMQVRRVLLSLAERYQGRPETEPVGGPLCSAARVPEATAGPSDLACWTEFHETVGRLAVELRDVVDLLFYQGLSQEEAASVLAVSDRTVRNRWRKARLELFEKLGGRFPDSPAGGA